MTSENASIGAELQSAYDVVVVGSGAAGMSAAITAASRGLSTVLIEKAPHWEGRPRVRVAGSGSPTPPCCAATA